ncbi:MAG TPA: MmcQ/YjbR family DNA-binding protein [Candidatus Limnocylindrales bacterium]|nr:MmcQ/YjbR family DNA-binding protein [Candidatus Limnocylindrales bacterium]
MTIDELRSYCLSLPGAHEKETWGDADHAGDVTFRVKDKIFVITGPDGGTASIRTTTDQQAELLDTFPGVFRSAPYVGRFGWVTVDLAAVDRELVQGIIEAAWRRTAPKAVVRAHDEAPV